MPKSRKAANVAAVLVVGLIAAFALSGCGPFGGDSYSAFSSRSDSDAAQANVRAAIPAVMAYYQDNNTYKGLSLKALQMYDVGIALDPIDPAFLARNNFCLQSTVGESVASRHGPMGSTVEKPCS